jgi:hypothetical protein
VPRLGPASSPCLQCREAPDSPEALGRTLSLNMATDTMDVVPAGDAAENVVGCAWHAMFNARLTSTSDLPPSVLKPRPSTREDVTCFQAVMTGCRTALEAETEPMRNELLLLKRLIHRNKSQHRSSLHMRCLFQLRVACERLDAVGLTLLLDSAQAATQEHDGSGTFPGRNTMPSRELLDLVLARLVTAAVLCQRAERAAGCTLRCFKELIRHALFMPFAITCLSLAARLRSLVQQHRAALSESHMRLSTMRGRAPIDPESSVDSHDTRHYAPRVLCDLLAQPAGPNAAAAPATCRADFEGLVERLQQVLGEVGGEDALAFEGAVGAAGGAGEGAVSQGARRVEAAAGAGVGAARERVDGSGLGGKGEGQGRGGVVGREGHGSGDDEDEGVSVLEMLDRTTAARGAGGGGARDGAKPKTLHPKQDPKPKQSLKPKPKLTLTPGHGSSAQETKTAQQSGDASPAPRTATSSALSAQGEAGGRSRVDGGGTGGMGTSLEGKKKKKKKSAPVGMVKTGGSSAGAAALAALGKLAVCGGGHSTPAPPRSEGAKPGAAVVKPSGIGVGLGGVRDERGTSEGLKGKSEVQCKRGEKGKVGDKVKGKSLAQMLMPSMDASDWDLPSVPVCVSSKKRKVTTLEGAAVGESGDGRGGKAKEFGGRKKLKDGRGGGGGAV